MAVPIIPTTDDGLERRDTGSIRLDDGNGRRLKGYAIVFNRLSHDLGGFREQIAPEAVNRTLQQGLDVRALFNHDNGQVLGRTKAGTLRLDRDPHGLNTVIDPPNTTMANDLIESVRRGDISGMSFRFKTLVDEWDFTQDPPIRTLMDMEIREVSIVTFPAYPDTTVAVRSMDQAAKNKPWMPSLAFRERQLRSRSR